MRSSAIARLIIMGVLTCGLLVPIAWIQSIVGERASRRDDAVREVSATWGGPQMFGGVVLSVPYTYVLTDGRGQREEVVRFAHIVPRELRVETTLRAERRRRGIFNVVVYRAELAVRGRFRPDTLDWVRPSADRIDWSGAVLSVGLSDPRGLSRTTALTWNGREQPFGGGVPPVGLFAGGIQSKLTGEMPLSRTADTPFAFTLLVNGTREVRFVPTAEETTVTIKADWPHPSFVGGPLPDQPAVSGAGFTTQWRVSDVARSFPGRWTGVDVKDQTLQERARISAFGVDLIQPVDIYQQTERAVKYAVLFIVLTFVVFFLWEVFGGTRLHPVQYAFVGFALCVFYLLLISISEHAGFDIAYAVASTTITLLIGGYSRAVLQGGRQATSVVASLAGLYGFLYLLLRLEDYALLAGSIGVLAVLAFLMFVTRRMDWYEVKLGSQE